MEWVCSGNFRKMYCEPLHLLSLLEAPDDSIGRLVSAGLERLVYTEKVGGSNPSAPTISNRLRIYRYL